MLQEYRRSAPESYHRIDSTGGFYLASREFVHEERQRSGGRSGPSNVVLVPVAHVASEHFFRRTERFLAHTAVIRTKARGAARV